MPYQIRVWLVFCALIVLSMVILGGYTRLSNAGLSIVQWKPVTGILYPSDEAKWQQEFFLYKHSPEFKHRNFSFSLEEFKQIYFIEYAHRLLGRLLGLIFILPFFYFLGRKAFSPSLAKHLVIIFTLGAIQGGLGWYMVKSGLYNAPEVSQYRLALHLVMALIIYGLLIWQVFRISAIVVIKNKMQLYFAVVLLILVVLQIFTGALVAGLDAGLVYNTYPLMDGRLIPHDLLMMQPWYVNFGENIVTTQFTHRTLAVLLIILSMGFIRNILVSASDKLLVNAVWCLLVVILLQFGLGVLTLINLVPVSLALLHQFGAMLLFTNLLFIINLLTCKTYVKL